MTRHRQKVSNVILHGLGPIKLPHFLLQNFLKIPVSSESSQVLDYAEFVTRGKCGVECHDKFPEIFFLHFDITLMQPSRRARN